MSRVLLLTLALLSLSVTVRVTAQATCGNNGRCVAATQCPYWATKTSSATCTGDAVCCESPTCTSGSEVGLCQDTSSTTCSSGRLVSGLCPGPNAVRCCLPAPPPVQCAFEGSLGQCIDESTCTTGKIQAGLCPGGNSIKCCLPSESAPQRCFAQGQEGQCVASGSCASGNSVSGVCDVAGTECCLPTAAPPAEEVSCEAQGMTGKCQLATSACASGNSVAGVCGGGARCCLPRAATNYGDCSMQGQRGTCQKASTCAGTTVAGLCPGGSDIRCCLPQPLNYGSCTGLDGESGECTSDTCDGGKVYTGLCPGPSSVRCCVRDSAPKPPPPKRDFGRCSIGRQLGTCKPTSECGTTPTQYLCPGPADIRCCPDEAETAPPPIYLPAPPAAGTFYGACSPPSGGVGSCKPTSACSTTTTAGLCAGPNNIQCCADGGPAYVAGADLPGGRGFVVPSLSGNAATCLAGGSNQASFVVLDGWKASCKLEPKLASSVQLAQAAGLAVDVTFTPSLWCGMNARGQASALVAVLTPLPFGRVWVRLTSSDTSGWLSGTAGAQTNLEWVLDAVDVLTAALGNARVGVLTSAAQWSAIMGASTTAPARLAQLPLLYAGGGRPDEQSFIDFASFGGWTYPYAKLQNGDSACGLSVQSVWLPARSATAAPAAPAPAEEADGAPCQTDSDASGFCRSVAGCPATRASVRGLCADQSQTCCLTALPPAPPAPTETPVPITYGFCTAPNGAQGICQPFRNCGASDTRVDGVAGCSAAPDASDPDVTCCIPSTPITPPPNGAPTGTDPPPYEPYPLAAAAEGKRAVQAIAVPAPRRLAATSGSSGTSSVCINTAGLALIEEFEGFEPNFYNDAVGIKTIGFGTACHAYPCNTIRPPITRAQARSIMQADLMAQFAPCVRKYIKSPLNSNQFSALLAFVYNVGCGGIQGQVGKVLNAGQYSLVPSKMAAWNKAGGKVLAGLVRRREAEGKLFANPVLAPCFGPGDSGSSEGQSWGSCSSGGKKGDCIDASDCEGTTVSGLCPGPSTVKCCLDSTPLPPPLPANACGNGGTCKDVSQCNTGTHRTASGLCPGPSNIKCCLPKSAAASDGWWAGATRDNLGAGSSYVTSDSKRGVSRIQPKIVLHTTEGSTYEGARAAYSGTHPHFTVTFQRGFFQAYQHCSVLTSAKALKHPSGTVETNRARAVQIEIVGFAQKVRQLDQRYLDGIRTLLRWIETVFNMPRRGARFLPYPSSYGNSAVRMSDKAWLEFSGVCGHQHVPANSHGDPGDLDIDYLMSGSGTVWPSDPETTEQPNGDYGTCTSNGRAGRCQDRSSCGGTAISGLCPGSSSVACCIENFGACSAPASGGFPAAEGMCVESSTCNGRKVSGLCAGPSSVQCCVPDYGTCAQGTNKGVCQSASSCSGTVVAGLCSGPSSIMCCLPKKTVDYGSCTVPYATGAVTGQCISKSACAAPFTTYPGLCPGSSDISCCHQPAPVRTYGECGNDGMCQDVSTCTGTVKRGLCPGASNIACCERAPRVAAMDVPPLSSPRALFAMPTPSNDSAPASAALTVGSALTAEEEMIVTPDKLTLCMAGGQQGFCLDPAVGDAVCSGVVTFPSSCGSSLGCCTPASCAPANGTVGVCIPPSECAAQSGYVTPGLCGADGVDGPTSCCSGTGVSQCDSELLLACLLADGEAGMCARSANCAPTADLAYFTSAVQSAPSGGVMAHARFDDPDAGGDGGAAADIRPSLLIAAILAAVTYLARDRLY